MPANPYSHLTITQDGTHLRIYINGVEQNVTFSATDKKGAWLNLVTGNITSALLGSAGVNLGTIINILKKKK